MFTPATEESPAMSATGASEKEMKHLSTQEFGQQLSLLAAEVKDLVKMARKVGSLKPGKSLVLANGEKFGAKELNALVSRHNRTLKQLKKNYVARGTRKRRVQEPGKERKAGAGFDHGSFLREPLVDFLRTANFGGVNGPAGGEPIRDVIAPLLENNLLSRSILTVLFTIYELANGLRFEEDGKKYFRAGPDMVKFLGPYLSTLESQDRAKSDEEMLDAKGNPKPRFDRNKFVYNRLQSIGNPGVRPKRDLKAEELEYLENPQVKETLESVQEIVSTALKAWNPK